MLALEVWRSWDKAPVSMEKIEDLVLDFRFYPRKEVDQAVVQNYVRAMQAGSVFPPVKVGVLKGKKIIVDGVHRVSARKALKIEYVDAVVLPFESEAALFAEAVRLNSSHGKTFTNDEVKANIKRLQKYKFDVREIVALTHVPASEIYRETAAPVSVLTAPCGKKFVVENGKVKHELTIRELTGLKNALVDICNLAEAGRIPLDEPVIKDLVTRCRLDLGKVRFHV